MGRRPKERTGLTFNIFSHLDGETVRAIWGILFVVLTIFFGLASFHRAGRVGDVIYPVIKDLLGLGYFLLPLITAFTSVMFFRSIKKEFTLGQILSSILFFVSSLGLIDIFSHGQGGKVGVAISYPLISILDVYFTVVILVALMLISFIIMFNYTMNIEMFTNWYANWKEKRALKKEEKENAEDDDEEDVGFVQNNATEEDEEESDDEEAEEDEEEEKTEKKPFIKKFFDKKEDEDGIGVIATPTSLKPFSPPPLSLLSRDKGKPEVGDIKANANIIKRTLQNFGITVEMDEISIGPSVTRYALKPAEGVKLSRIVGLQNDLSLALAAHPLRIEAPIPGKSLVGIEIPNSSKTTVGLATLLASKDYSGSEKPLLVALGKSISGQAHFGNVAKMPHMLIAGATGSGKSVTIHTLVTSLLYRNSPESMRFLMIDPKRVELTLYKKIPHLLTPVITDAKKAILALRWAAKEMDRRYDVLESESVRDIESYHKNVYEPEVKKAERKGVTEDGEEKALPEAMPYIVVIIDELADIMQAYPRELEAAIVRLAQMSRAVGIHLVLSTQRPSVNVITGLIKANVPTRLALQVSSQIDSRTILDAGGAEKLLGAGDMLYMSGEMSKPVRLQSAYISEAEVKKVVNFISDQYSDEVPDEIDFTAQNTSDSNAVFSASLDSEANDEDDLYEEARSIVLEAGKASTSYIQRKLRVGYARAARLMDMLEERGIIGPADGSKPREVISDGNDSSTEDTDDYGETDTDSEEEEENRDE